MVRFVLIILLICSTTSCARGLSKLFSEQAIDEVPLDPDASPDFKQGWADGCEVGMSSGSNTFYKMFYASNQADGFKMANSIDYRTAWGNAFWFCYRATYVKQKSSIWGSILGGYY